MTSDAPFLGILSLDNAFPRVPGDGGNPESYPFPARVRVVDGADSPAIVRDGRPDPAIVARFVEAAQKLEADGAAVLVSTCGFLVTAQDEIARSVTIPVMLSALSLYPAIAAVRPGPVGVITASRAALGEAALAAAGIGRADVRIAGLEDVPAFADAILPAKAAQARDLDTRAIASALAAKGRALLDAEPNLSAILLECANLPPYSGALRAATGLPVFDILDGAGLIWSAAQK